MEAAAGVWLSLAVVAVGVLVTTAGGHLTRGACRALLRDHGSAILLVVAHPDDEAMFFSPTMLALARSGGGSVHVLCLSTGDAYGLGAVRRRELERACQALQVDACRVRIVDAPDLRDGMATHWPSEAVQREVRRAVDNWRITQIITFDARGVSGHVNHVATFAGVRDYLAWRHTQPGQEPVQAWSLVTHPLAWKFSGCLGVPLALALHHGSGGVSGAQRRRHGTQAGLVLLNPAPSQTVRAMTRHWSQLVWYRWLFILFSSYSWVNTLEPLAGSL